MGGLLCCVQVDQSKVAIREQFGKFDEVLEPGCHCLPWFLGKRVVGHLSLRLQQLDVRCETKTKVTITNDIYTAFGYLRISRLSQLLSEVNVLLHLCLQDNVFVNVVASIQYRALADKASDAFYKLTNTRSQIQAYVFDGTFFKFRSSLDYIIVAVELRGARFNYACSDQSKRAKAQPGRCV